MQSPRGLQVNSEHFHISMIIYTHAACMCVICGKYDVNSTNAPKTFPAEFLASVLAIYQDLLFGKNPNTVIVPTSIAVEQLPLLVTEENSTQELQEGVEASTLAECINGLCDRFKHR